MKYGYQKITNINFENVNEKLRKSLMEVGFGIITEIDVQSTFKEKLGIDYERFQIRYHFQQADRYSEFVQPNCRKLRDHNLSHPQQLIIH